MNLRVVHMASLARSGETLTQSLLSRHSHIAIAGQLVDSAAGEERLRFFRDYPDREISTSHPILKNFDLRGKRVILVKQGIWEHQWPFDGFILSRNPLSVFQSLSTYDQPWRRLLETLAFRGGRLKLAIRLRGNIERVFRWMKDIDPELRDAMIGQEFIEIFSALYNRRMGALAKSNLPIMPYEELVTNPKLSLETLQRCIGVPVENLLATQVDSLTKGHGKNDLSRPVTSTTIEKYMRLKTLIRRRLILETNEVAKCLGYRFDYKAATVLAWGKYES